MLSPAFARFPRKSLILGAFALALWALLLTPEQGRAAERLVVAELYSSTY